MHLIKNRIKRELEDLAAKERWSGADLEAIKILTDAAKDVVTTCAMEEEMGDDGYSEKRHYVRAHYSRADGMDGHQRDGRYPMDEGSYGDRDGYPGRRNRDSRGRYARGDGKDELREKLEQMMSGGSAEERECARRLMETMDRM